MLTVRYMEQKDVAATGAVVADFDPSLVDEAISVFCHDLERSSEWPSQRLRLVAEDHNGLIVGTMGYGPGPLPGRDIRWTDWLMVLSSHRRLGVATLLYEQIERALISVGCRRVYLDVGTATKQPDAIAFHQGCGYRIEATLKDYWGPTDDLVVMSKRLRKEAS